MKEQEFDFYRWLAYGGALVVLALTTILLPNAIWVFLIVFLIALADFGYCQIMKYSVYKKKLGK